MAFLQLGSILLLSAATTAYPVEISPAKKWAKHGPGGEPSFERHVVPLLTKVGCNNRSCHGSFQGKGGFRLSLFGYEPSLDYRGLVTEGRVDIKAIDESLALQKPLGKMAHKGGRRWTPGSWQYRLFRQWLATGARPAPKTEPKLKQLQILPPSLTLAPGQSQQLQTVAQFTNGHRQEMTPLTLFSSNDDSVVSVNENGLLTASGPGSTAIVAKYSNGIATIPVIVPRESNLPFPDFPPNNAIDTLVAAQLKKLGIHPSKLSSDAAFLRRAYLDVTGTLPTADEARAFLQNRRPDKRERLIDRLLWHPDHSLYWATIFSDWLGNNQSNINNFFKMTALFHGWLHDKLKSNLPYDQMVRAILTATSREGRSLEAYLEENRKVTASLKPRYGFDNGTYARRKTLDLFWLRRVPDRPKELSIRTANAFLGIQIQCAECHNHPFDRWTQNDFEGYTSFFRVVDICDLNGSPRSGRRYDYDKVALYAGASKRYLNLLKKHPPKLLAAETIPYKANGPDPRLALAKWMTAPENPTFAKNIVNRVWHHYFGTGIVDPIDDLNEANPPSNPGLLEWLAKDFIAHRFDLRHLHRRILQSRTYQLSHRPNPTNKNDTRGFSHAQVRRLPAEVALDALAQITDTPLRWNSYSAPPGTRAIGVPTPVRTGKSDYFLQIFGKPKRQQTCACERSNQSALAQALYLLNDADLQARIQDPKGRLARLLQQFPSDDPLIEELYLLCLARYPTSSEKDAIRIYLRQSASRAEAIQDVLWSLINVREFLFVR